MRSLAFGFVLLGGVSLGAPALATDTVMPQPVTDYGPSSTDDAPTAPPAVEPTAAEYAPSPAAEYARQPACDNCQPPRRYDTQEVIRKIREIDRSRTINTTEMASEYAPRHDAGPRYRVRSDMTLVNFVVHHYRVIESPGLIPASEGVYRPSSRPRRIACKYGKPDRYGSCRRHALHVRG